MPGLDPNSPTQVAQAIAVMCDQLEDATLTYRDDIDRAAKSNARYKLRWAQAMLQVIADTRSRRVTVQEREALVEVGTNDDRVIADVDEARAKATKEHLNSLRVRLDAARSLGANLRGQV